MSDNLNLNQRVIDLTVDQLSNVIANKVLAITKSQLSNLSLPPSYSYKGIKGIQEIFQCSKSKALGIRASGIIDDACIQNGNSFLIDKNKALELMKGGKL